MDFSVRLAPVERPELYLVSSVSMPKEQTHSSKSFAISRGLAYQTCWDVEQSAF
jgi:hypothetical protein